MFGCRKRPDVWRPVTAEPVRDDLYRLIDAPPEGEVWEFQQGDTVRCRRRQLSGDGGRITDYLVAVENRSDLPPRVNLTSSLFVPIVTSCRFATSFSPMRRARSIFDIVN